MPRGGHKRLRPRRRRSYSSAENSNDFRHRTRSTSCRRTTSPHLFLPQQPLTAGRSRKEEEEQQQQQCDERHLPENVTGGRSPHDLSVWGEEHASAAAQVQLPPTAGVRQHVDATPTSTLGSAVSAESIFSHCSPARTAASSEHFNSPLSASDETVSAAGCPVDALPLASVATLPVQAISTSRGFCSGPAAAGTAPDRATPPAGATTATCGGAVAFTIPADPTCTPFPLVTREGRVGAATARDSEAASSDAIATVGHGHSQSTEAATHFRVEDKEAVRAASDATASSSMFLPPEAAELSLRNCACPTRQPCEVEWQSAAEAGDHQATYADSLAARHPVPVAVEAPAAAIAVPGSSVAAAATRASEPSVTGRRGLLADDSIPLAAVAVPCDRSTETPLLNFLEARGREFSVPQQRAEARASHEKQQLQQMTQPAAAASTYAGSWEYQRPPHSGILTRRADNASAYGLVCNNSSRSTAALSSCKEDSQAVSARSPCFHSFCLSSSSVSFPSRSPPVAYSITAASSNSLGPSAAGFCVATSLGAGAASGAAAAADASAATSLCGDTAGKDGFFLSRASGAAFAAARGGARDLQRLVDVSDASSSVLLRDTADAPTHPSALLQHHQLPVQRSRRVPVLKIAGGSCQRLLLQTPELLRLVHCHNPRGILEDAVDGALKLRDLRQVVGRHGMQRPSIEVRRNCVLVNLPFVRAILLHACVVLLPPADFSSAGYSPLTQFKKKRQQQHPVQQQLLGWENKQLQPVGEACNGQQQGVWGPQREQVDRRSPQGQLQRGNQQECAWGQRQQMPWERQQGDDLIETEGRKQQQRLQQEERGMLTSPAESGGGASAGATHLMCENHFARSNREGFAATCRRLWYLLCCRRHNHRSGQPPAPLSSSHGSNNGHSDYTFLWGGEAAPFDLRSHSYRGASLRDITTQKYPFSCAQRKVHPVLEEEQERSNSEPAAGVSPVSALEDWLDGNEDSIYVEQQHRLILKLLRITAAAKAAEMATTTADAPGGTAAATLSGPAECAALEAILEHVCDGLTAELEPIAEAAASVLRVIHEQPSSTRKLRKVADLRRRLDSIKSEARGADDALRSLLDSEDHLRRLEVSRFWGGEEAAAEWLRPSRSANSQDIEMLLESYEQELDALLKGIVRTEEALDDALQLMELHLASIRNAFLKSEIALDVVGVLFGGIAAIASVFGMNIKSGWEDKQNTFWTLAGGLCFLSVITCCLVYVWFRRQKL